MHVHRKNAATVLPVVATTMTPEMARERPRREKGQPKWRQGNLDGSSGTVPRGSEHDRRQHLYRSEIAAPAADVLAWHGNPGAFERLTPPWMNVRVLEGVGGIAPGDWKRLRVAAGPIGVPWTLVHSAAEDGTGFVDEQTDGPFASWRHEHRFLSDGPERSVLEDRITYQLPFGAVGQLVAGRQLERRLDDLFRFRHGRTQVDLARHAAADLARPQRIAISGASGLVGSQLVPFLRAGGHDVARLVRRRPSAADEIFWDPATDQIDAASLEGMDAVIHLAGVSIAGGRWTTARKAAILSSRLQGTKSVGGNPDPSAAPASRADLGIGHRVLRRCRERPADRGIAAGRGLPCRRVPGLGGGDRAGRGVRHPGRLASLGGRSCRAAAVSSPGWLRRSGSGWEVRSAAASSS